MFFKQIHSLRHAFAVFAAASVLVLPPISAVAAVPEPVAYQGFLTDAAGSPLTAVLSVGFSIYTVPIGGAPIWTETQVVSVDSGLFTVDLGGVPGNEFPPGAFETDLYLAINVDSDGEMTPRVAFDSVPYAKKAADADTLEGNSPADLDQSDEIAALQANTVLQLDTVLSLGIGDQAVLAAGGGLVSRSGADPVPDLVLGGNGAGAAAGRLASDPAFASSDLIMQSNDDLQFELNNDNDAEDADFAILDGNDTNIFNLDDDGTLSIQRAELMGTSTAATLDLLANTGADRVTIAAQGFLSGGEISLFNSADDRTVNLRGDTGSGSRFSMFNDAGQETVRLESAFSAGGLLSLRNNSGATRVSLSGDNGDGGSLLLGAADGSSTVFLNGQAPDNAGIIEVRNNVSATRVVIDGEDLGAGRIDVRQANGINGVLIRGEEFSDPSDGAVIELFANDGTETIELDGGPVAGSAFLFVNGAVSGDVKSAVVTMSTGERRLLYATESPEVWFEDVGSAQLNEGFAVVYIEPMYRETITVDKKNPLRVLVTLTDDCNGIYVKKYADRFEVHELNHGTSNATFDYKIIGKRKGYEDRRLEPFSRMAERQGEPADQNTSSRPTEALGDPTDGAPMR